MGERVLRRARIRPQGLRAGPGRRGACLQRVRRVQQGRAGHHDGRHPHQGRAREDQLPQVQWPRLRQLQGLHRPRLRRARDAWQGRLAPRGQLEGPEGRGEDSGQGRVRAGLRRLHGARHDRVRRAVLPLRRDPQGRRREGPTAGAGHRRLGGAPARRRLEALRGEGLHRELRA